MHYSVAIDQYLNYLKYERESSFHTVTAYKRDIIEFIFFIGLEVNSPLIEIERKSTKEYLEYLHLKKNFKSATIRRKIYALNSFFSFLLDEGLIHSNPFIKLKMPARKRVIPIFLSTEELDKLVLTAEKFPNKNTGMRDLICLSILRYTGCRRSELLNLKWEDINISEAVIKFNGKGNKERLLPIHPKLISYLITYKLHCDANPQEVIVKGKNGNRLSNSSLKKITEKYLTLAGLNERKITPHKIRHSFASELLKNGNDIRIIQQWLGHEEISTTAIYTHVTFDQLRKVWGEY